MHVIDCFTLATSLTCNYSFLGVSYNCHVHKMALNEIIYNAVKFCAEAQIKTVVVWLKFVKVGVTARPNTFKAHRYHTYLHT